MGLLEKVTGEKRPAYHTYKVMREKLRDFQVGNVADLSIDHIRIFKFITPKGNVYVAWDADGGQDTSITDLSAVFGNRKVMVTQIVTELNPDNSPVVPEAMRVSTTAIPLSIIPVFIE